MLGSIPNAIGQRINTEFDPAGTRIAFRKDGRLRGLVFTNNNLCKTAEEFGTIALASPTPGAVSYWCDWPAEQQLWSTGWLKLWDDFADDGKLESVRGHGRDKKQGFMTVSVTVPPRSEKEVTFLLTWHFPNRYSWSPGKPISCCDKGDWIGNYYTTKFRNAWDVARKVAPKLAKLEADTVRFVGAMVDNDLPLEMKDAALSNITVLRTQSCFRTPDGLFYGFEGCCETNGCCHGSCTHVWNYEHTTPFLFGPLARTMREVEFAHATERSGFMHFRVYLPLKTRAKKYNYAAADGQMGCIMKMYRDWQLSGDTKLFKKLWPNVKKALAFAWKKNGWDPDGDGVMEGCQHNTFDVEWYGPNPLMQCWYLGALRAGEEMAKAMGDTRFAAACRKRFEFGSKWMDKHLFNGEYYAQHIEPRRMDQLIKGLRGGMGGYTPTKPAFQLGKGCLVPARQGLPDRSTARPGHRQRVRPGLSAQTHPHPQDAAGDHEVQLARRRLGPHQPRPVLRAGRREGPDVRQLPPRREAESALQLHLRGVERHRVH
ncbi:MAG: GH116 family glycosyl hydrolase, partial [Planctomycetota bacterium]